MTQFRVQVPRDLTSDIPISGSQQGEIHIELVWDNPSEIQWFADPLVIQRLLTLAAIATDVSIFWSDAAVEALRTSPGQVPLLASAIQLNSASHLTALGAMPLARRVALQQVVAEHRLMPQWFDAADCLICTDNERRGWHRELYSEPGRLRARDEFARLVDPLIRARVSGLQNEDQVLQWKDSLISVIYELFENTHEHARFDYDRRTIGRSVIRLLTVRIVDVTTGANPSRIATKSNYECLELSVIDSGVGFFGARMRRPINEDDDLKDEWLNLRACLDKHVDDLPADSSHKGLGLYEVLRALYLLRGAIQVRSGRVFGYRSFFPIDLRQQMEPRDSSSRPGMPRGKLLDFAEPYRSTPTANAMVRGVVAKALIPLQWHE